MDAHRTIKEQNQQNGATKITCCGVELSKDILKIFAEKIEIIEQDTKNSQNTFEQMVELVYFNDNDCAIQSSGDYMFLLFFRTRLSELFKKYISRC